MGVVEDQRREESGEDEHCNAPKREKPADFVCKAKGR